MLKIFENKPQPFPEGEFVGISEKPFEMNRLKILLLILGQEKGGYQNKFKVVRNDNVKE